MRSWPKVDLTREEIQRCWDFAEKIILSGNQYDRMNKEGLSREKRLLYRIKRTFAGKVGEYAFHKYLMSRGYKDVNFDNMFTIFKGTANVDDADFVCKNGKTIDIKTTVFKKYSKLVVSTDQLKSIPKDYYVGVKLKLDGNITSYDQLEISDVSSVFICGYADRKYLENQPTENLGESECKVVWLSSLFDIYPIMNLIDKQESEIDEELEL